MVARTGSKPGPGKMAGTRKWHRQPRKPLRLGKENDSTREAMPNRGLAVGPRPKSGPQQTAAGREPRLGVSFPLFEFCLEVRWKLLLDPCSHRSASDPGRVASIPCGMNSDGDDTLLPMHVSLPHGCSVSCPDKCACRIDVVWYLALLHVQAKKCKLEGVS